MTPKRPKGAGAIPNPVDRAAPRPDPSELYAALDLGTNSCRMLIAHPVGSEFQVLDSFSKSVQLGQGLESSGVRQLTQWDRTPKREEWTHLLQWPT